MKSEENARDIVVSPRRHFASERDARTSLVRAAHKHTRPLTMVSTFSYKSVIHVYSGAGCCARVYAPIICACNVRARCAIVCHTHTHARTHVTGTHRQQQQQPEMRASPRLCFCDGRRRALLNACAVMICLKSHTLTGCTHTRRDILCAHVRTVCVCVCVCLYTHLCVYLRVRRTARAPCAKYVQKSRVAARSWIS